MSRCNLRDSIGERLKAARSSLGMTQKAWCEASGMKLPSLRDYELGNRVPGGEALSLYARAGIRVDWLLTGEGSMRSAPNPDVIGKFHDYWHGFGHEMRQEAAMAMFVDAYNSGVIEPVPGHPKISAADLSDAYVRPPPPPPPAVRQPGSEYNTGSPSSISIANAVLLVSRTPPWTTASNQQITDAALRLLDVLAAIRPNKTSFEAATQDEDMMKRTLAWMAEQSTQ